ncbi:MAG: NAD(+) synthase [Pirellulales bacterium]|nr:NAD(+) synthase [Pirellulales bacterium]
MTKLRLAAAGVNQTPLAWETNCNNLLAAISAAREAEAGVLCLPELSITGYGCEDTFFATGVQETALEILAEIVPQTQDLVTTLGLPLAIDGQLYNVMALCCDGKLLGLVGKQHLAADGIHYEPRWFAPWPAGHVREVSIGASAYPVGDLLFDCGGVKIGMEICRDAWVDDRSGGRLAARGADIILNPSASHFAFNKQEIRREFVLRGSREFHVSYAYANLLGNESGRAIFDGGTLIASRGEMLAAGARLSFADWVMATADIDVAASRRDREGASRPRCDLQSLGGATIEAQCTFPPPTAPRTATRPAAWDASPASKAEEFSRAVPLALFDYLRKSRAGGLVVSLSGGADSSAIVTMVWLLVELAIADIGREVFLRKLAHIQGLAEQPNNGALVGRLLTCVYQRTRNSSQVTHSAAVQVTKAVGAEFVEWNIDNLVDGYVDMVSQATDRQLTWKQDDLTLQNIQARVRGPGAWLLANMRGALLLATSNRSEAAVGYATMDGDTCGGLAPITGIDKAYLLEWLQWMERAGPAGAGPLDVLAVVNCQEPTAELRPPGEHQTDEGDLMPYTVLDTIERAAIRDKQMPVEVLQTLEARFADYSQTQLGHWTERFFRLWCRNQWKRERYAPSFHLDDENLDPKTWCRFPILSGGFDRELADLRARTGADKQE